MPSPAPITDPLTETGIRTILLFATIDLYSFFNLSFGIKFTDM